jgi:hypothetical protein
VISVWSVPRVYKRDEVYSLVDSRAVKEEQEVGVKWPRVSCRSAHLRVQLVIEDCMWDIWSV